MEKQTAGMIIEVTGCHDCPFEGDGYTCNLSIFTWVYVLPADVFDNYTKGFPPSCPLQTESITIKKKDNDN